MRRGCVRGPSGTSATLSRHACIRLQAGRHTESRFRVRDSANDLNDLVQFTWSRGAPTLVSELGDPTHTTDYVLCAYDFSMSGTVVTKVVEAGAAPAGLCGFKPCWKANQAGTTYAYKNRLTNVDGVFELVVKAAPEGKAKLVVTLKGVNADLPATVGVNQFFAQDDKVIVQVHNGEGTCWEASYGAPAIKNLVDRFIDKND